MTVQGSYSSYILLKSGTSVMSTRHESNLFRDAVEDLVHLHACRVPVVPEADHEDPVLFGQDGLVHLPAVVEMREHFLVSARRGEMHLIVGDDSFPFHKD
ncbi:hypothetical protein EYF80_050853 [Liparis tanakae]|uniref:Uncharacterized protein n=1 Tax=Liparis tanakae TaxID=230148 RepID=A0A4Z2FCR2_9TELE|nr:hypothetical protein EYF80_050853 [Liparis tanakae]